MVARDAFYKCEQVATDNKKRNMMHVNCLSSLKLLLGGGHCTHAKALAMAWRKWSIRL